MIAGLAVTLLAPSVHAFGGAPSGCSEYMGDATINEVHDHRNEHWVEVRLLEEGLDSSTWEEWIVATATGPDDGDSFDYSLEDASVNNQWLLLQVDKKALALNGETEVALFDADGEYIDYLSINGAENEAPLNCSTFPYDTEATSSSQYKSLFRNPDGIGEWTEADSPGAGGGTTPGEDNDGGGAGSQPVDASSPQYEGDGAALYTRVADRAFGVTVRYDADEPEPEEVTLDLVRDEAGSCGETLETDWGSSDQFTSTDGGYEAQLSGLAYAEAVSRARVQIRITFSAGNQGGSGGGAGCGWFPFLPWCGGGASGGGGNAGQTTLEYCSSDAFTIRPEKLSLSATSADGEALTRNNWSGYAPTSCSAEACQAAGEDFTLEVEATPTGQGFDADIQLEEQTHPEAPAWMTPGTLAAVLAFDGTADRMETTVATYPEAGLLAVDAHDGGAFAAVDSDAGHCVAGESHNQPDGAGLVGCRTAVPAAVPLGRFIPREFVRVDSRTIQRLERTEAGCTPAPAAFTYLGEGLATEVTLEARNADGAVTRHYRGEYASLGPADAANWVAIHAPEGAGRQELTARLERETGTVLEGWADGETGRTSLRFPLTVERGSDPDGPWPDVRFGFTATDADGVALAADGLDSSGDGVPDRALAGTSALRYGRLAVASDHAAEFAALALPVTAEYWGGTVTGFEDNTDDECTPLQDGAGSRLSYRSAPAGEPFGPWGDGPDLGATSAALVPATTLTGGEAELTLTAPGEAGRVEVCPDLTGLEYLHYTWPEPEGGVPAGCADSPVGRATFGVSKGDGDVLFTREVFR